MGIKRVEARVALIEDVTPMARRILVGNGFSAVGSGLALPFLVIYIGEVQGLGIAFADVVIAYMAVMSLAATGPVGALFDRFGPRPIMIISLTVMGVGVAMLGCATHICQKYRERDIVDAARPPVSLFPRFR